MFMLVSEFIKFRPQIRAVSRLEVLPRNLEKAGFESESQHRSQRSRRESEIRNPSRPAIRLNQALRTDQQGVSRKRRHRLIGRISIAGWSERKGLPPALASVMETIDPGKGRGSKIADAVRRGKRRHMQQQAGCAVIGRKWRNGHSLRRSRVTLQLQQPVRCSQFVGLRSESHADVLRY